jgi:NAD(P)-dependent dehydrogenase (short-subunit alcohol dehydrogenase family)
MSGSARHIVVSGAGRGIGSAIAEKFAQPGTRVTVLSRSQGDLDEVAGRVRAAGAECTTAVLDVADTEAVLAFASGIDSVDVLVNNAGTDTPTAFNAVTPDLFDRLIATNLRSAFFLTQGLLGALARARGAVVNISSQLSLVGVGWESAYSASKAGLDGLTRALAIELAPQGIRVNSIAPTVVETPLTAAALQDPTLREMILSRIPLGEFATMEDIAAATVFLASAQARMITGVVLPVDGGWTAQ